MKTLLTIGITCGAISCISYTLQFFNIITKVDFTVINPYLMLAASNFSVVCAGITALISVHVVENAI
jgi:hypothetical protein